MKTPRDAGRLHYRFRHPVPAEVRHFTNALATEAGGARKPFLRTRSLQPPTARAFGWAEEPQRVHYGDNRVNAAVYGSPIIA
jgi:hypothetical protein